MWINEGQVYESRTERSKEDIYRYQAFKGRGIHYHSRIDRDLFHQMRFEFSDDKEYVYISHDGVIEGVPFKDLTEESKQYVWEEIAKEHL